MSDPTYRDVLSILRLIDAAPFSNIEIEFEGTRLKICRAATPALAGTAPQALHHELPSPVTPKAELSKSKAMLTSPSAVPQPTEIPDGTPVKPPMEGTFYASPSPGAAPYVRVGCYVRKGDQLGSIEIMKLFTPIASPCDGTIQAILVANEQVVAKDQTLMVIQIDS